MLGLVVQAVDHVVDHPGAPRGQILSPHEVLLQLVEEALQGVARSAPVVGTLQLAVEPGQGVPPRGLLLQVLDGLVQLHGQQLTGHLVETPTEDAEEGERTGEVTGHGGLLSGSPDINVGSRRFISQAPRKLRSPTVERLLEEANATDAAGATAAGIAERIDELLPALALFLELNALLAPAESGSEGAADLEALIAQLSAIRAQLAGGDELAQLLVHGVATVEGLEATLDLFNASLLSAADRLPLVLQAHHAAQGIGEAAWHREVSGELLEAQVLDDALASLRVVPFRADGRQDGLRLLTLPAGSPVELLGLQRGDVVHAIDGQAVVQPGDLSRMLLGLRSGGTCELSLTRDGGRGMLRLVMRRGG